MATGSEPFGVAVVGCGNISKQYLKNLVTFPDVQVLFCADIDAGRAKAQAAAYGVPASGSGANFSWAGNGKVGVGQMTITESRPNDLVRCQFDFSKPWSCTNTHEFALKPEGSQTIVTWTMNGKAPFFFKLILVFVSCDTMMGKDVELGLANLKAVVSR